MNIGEKIKQRRKELGWSQRELAKRLGYSNHTTLTKIESGKVDINQSKVVLFAEVLRTTPAYLIGLEEDKKNPATMDGMSENRKKLMQMVDEIPEEALTEDTVALLKQAMILLAKRLQ